jgi:hypothetical protein
LNDELLISVVSAAVSALAAVAAAIIAYRSLVISRNALEISERGLKARTANISGYLIECIKRRAKHHDIIAFAVSYINHADSANSIVRAELEIHYATSNGTTNHLLFPSDATAVDVAEFPSLPRMRIPINLSARSTESGWLLFKVPRSAIPGSVDRYRLVAVTSAGNPVVVESYLMRTIFDGAKEGNTSC